MIEPYVGILKLVRLLDSGYSLPQLMDSAATSEGSAHLLMRMALMFNIHGDTEQAWALQHDALKQRRHYSTASDRSPTALRLLVLLKAGFMLDNTPYDFLLEGSDVACELLFITPDLPLPEALPPHDVVFVAMGHFERNQLLLERVREVLRLSQKPVLNTPRTSFTFDRDRLNALLQGIRGIVVPQTRAISRDELVQMAQCETLPPTIIRPLRSHAGIGLQRLVWGSDVTDYLNAQPEEEFYVAPYVEYRSDDGLYRKCRLLLLRGVPMVCHLAISPHWVVHYRTAGMEESEAKREEEARFMAESEQGFCRRHGAALAEIAARVGLDYVVVDCAETADGQLLFFEADNVSIIHATDPVGLYPYKQAQMNKVFRAFRDLLGEAAGSGGGLPAAAQGTVQIDAAG